MKRIDFRSDTVTWPTPAMKEAMTAALIDGIGDDVYGEDPTVNALEAYAAELTHKEAGMFVASGTMGNFTSILSQTNRGDEAIIGDGSHIYNWEAGNIAALGGVVSRILPMDKMGQMELSAIEGSVRHDNPHLPTSRLICLENTAGGRNGVPLSLDYMAAVRDIADRHDLSIHLDGARVFNAAVALNVPVHEITRYADSVSICLSKGLCAPVGSVVVGSPEFIHKARRVRKKIGGGMRQAGVIASAGLVALQQMTTRLAEDHQHAQQLAHGLSQIPGIQIDLDAVHTNMVFFSLDEDTNLGMGAADVSQQLREQSNIWIGAYGNAADSYFRAVTHYWVGSAEIEQLLQALRKVLLATNH